MMAELLTAHRPDYAHKPRTVWPPSLIIIHATRGHTTNGQQDEATLGFFANPGDRGGWAPTADCLVAADEDRAWVFEDSLEALRQWRSSWSAGYGSIGPSVEWGADEVAIGIEVGESDAREGYSDATVRRVAWLCAELQRRLGFTLPEQHIRTWMQTRSKPIPTGYIGHEELANGIKSGKTDPGTEWPWATFLQYVAEEKMAQSRPLSTNDAVGIWNEAWKQAHGNAFIPMPDGIRSVTIEPQEEGSDGDKYLVTIERS